MNSLLRTALLSIVPISALLIASAGCVASTDEGDVDQDFTEAETMHTGVMRAMPLQVASISAESAASSNAAPAGSHLNYYGGPVIQKVNVVPVYWNSTVANQAALNGFYAGITNSIFMDWLSEYNTASPAQTISRGTAQAGFVSNNSTTTTTEAKIIAELNKQFTAGTIPQPNNNNYYVVHFPKNTKITAGDGSKSCVQWCAYHGTYVRNGQNVIYGVMPDVSSTGCSGGCGASTAFNNETSVASHELIEAVTDPAVGLATVYGPPLGWYDQTYGEIGDICNAQQGTVLGGNGTTYTVQKQFSNVKNNCITNY